MKWLFFQLLSVAAITYSTIAGENTTSVTHAPSPTPTFVQGSLVNHTHSHLPWNTPPPQPNPVPVANPPPKEHIPNTSNQNTNKPIQINSISLPTNKTQISNSDQNQVGQINQGNVDGSPIAPPTSTPTNTTPSDGMNNGTSLTSTTIILLSFGISVFLVVAAVFGIRSYQSYMKREFSFNSGDSKHSFARADSPPLPSPINETEFNFTEQDRIPIDLSQFLPNKPLTPSPLAKSMNISSSSVSSSSS